MYLFKCFYKIRTWSFPFLSKYWITILPFWVLHNLLFNHLLIHKSLLKPYCVLGIVLEASKKKKKDLKNGLSQFSGWCQHSQKFKKQDPFLSIFVTFGFLSWLVGTEKWWGFPRRAADLIWIIFPSTFISASRHFDCFCLCSYQHKNTCFLVNKNTHNLWLMKLS